MIALIVFLMYYIEFCQFWLLCKIIASKSSIIEQEQRAYIKFRSLINTRKETSTTISRKFVEIELLQIPHYKDGLSYLEREGKVSKMSFGLVGRNLLHDLSIELVHDFYEVITAVLFRRFLN